MATNEILRFAETDTGTNLLTQSEYAADSQRPIGNQPGVARSKLVNKALRQASLIAAGLAEYIADNQANNVTDALTPQNIADYLQAALTGALGVTPPQFDNDTSLATTAFVQRALGNLSGNVGKNATGSLLASEVGRSVYLDSSTNFTLTLPALADVPIGATFEIFNINTGTHTIQRTGADAICVNNTTVSSLALGNGDSLKLVKITASFWLAISGSAQLGKSAAFGSSLAANGYQKLPSGLIIQWGTISTTAVTETVGTFPLAFPNSCFQIVGSSTSAGGESILVYKKTASTFGAQSRTSNTTALNSNTIAWIAIGY